MNFLGKTYILPLLISIIAFVVMFLVFEKKYYKWIKEYWFLGRTTASVLSSLFFVVGIVALSVIILDPREKEIKIQAPVKKSKTIILIDTSTSMLVEDVRPNRLERAALLAKHFARRASSHQISVLIFADITKKLVPFTNDRDLIDARIDSIKEIRNLNAGTSVEKAIAEASRMFNPKEKVSSGNILVITDGEEHGDAVNINVPKGIKIAFLGVGTSEGGSIPLKDTRGMFYGYKKDRALTVISKLNKKYFENAIGSDPNRKYFEASLTGIPSDEIFSFFNSTDGFVSEEENTIRPVGLKKFAYPGLFLILLSLLLRLRPQLGLILFLVSFNIDASEVPEEITKKLESLRNGELNKNEKINLADNLIKHKMLQAANELYLEQLSDKDIKNYRESYFNWATLLLEEKKYAEGISKLQKLESAFANDPELKQRIRENLKRSLQQPQNENKEKKEDQNKKESKKDKSENENETKGQESKDTGSGEGEGESTPSGDNKENNNPFELKDDSSKTSDNEKSDDSQNPKESEKKEKEESSKESEKGKEKKVAAPLLEQLKQDDRKLQIKLLDTSTQGNDNARKKDW